MHLRSDVYDVADYETAKQKAFEAERVHRSNLCVRYGPDVFPDFVTENDYSVLYPDSTRVFLDNVICAGEGDFDSVYETQFEIYKNSGSKFLCLVRDDEWEKVMEQGNRSPR